MILYQATERLSGRGYKILVIRIRDACGFYPSCFCLREMEIHLITIEIGLGWISVKLYIEARNRDNIIRIAVSIVHSDAMARISRIL